jgi:sugar phosphate isomerase/epimerase
MFSYQLYSSRNFGPLPATLKMLAEVGYKDTEGFGGLYADDAHLAVLAGGLAAHGLTMSTGHFGLPMIESDPDFVIKVAKAVGMKKVYCPYIAGDDRPKDGAGWAAFGARLQKAGAPLVAAGLGFGWHNHDFEFAGCADGTVPMFQILTGGPTLEWEMDVAWVVRGGSNPLAWIDAFKGRITSAHVKDIAAKGQAMDEDGWADVGHGVVEWAAIFAALKSAGVQYYVMEHDNPADDRRFATRSLASGLKL